MKLRKASILLLLFLFIPFNILAYSEYIIPGGENIGIELKSDGVIVVGTYKIDNNDPAKDAALAVGDIIISINNNKVSNINDLVDRVNKSTDKEIKIGYIRNDMTKYTNLKLYKQNGSYKTGLYVKDSIVGIGTLSFIDPNSKKFGALGHEILEKSTGSIFESVNGKIFESSVIGLVKSENGTPGEKTARYFSDKISGNVKENTAKGIFGDYTDTLPNKRLYKVATKNDVKTGEAVIRTVLNGSEIKEYMINILKINNITETKNILFEITDKELLEKTNGIIQGMSGSPILQGDYIIGAITHVLVDNPNRGYGIFITNMLEEAEN